MTARVSVIVPVYNDLARLLTCVRALDEQAEKHGSCEIVVVDNGSATSVVPALEGMSRVRVLYEERPGSYAARNRGILDASGSILAFTDADCIPEPDWIKRGTDYLDSRGDVALVAGKVLVFAADPERPTMAEVHETLNAFPQEAYAQEHGFAATANLFVRREVMSAVGLFREDVKSGGDREFGRRATAAGFVLEYVPDVVVRHPARRTLRQTSQKIKRTLAGVRDLRPYGAGSPSVVSPASIARDLLPPVRSTLRALRDRRLDRRSDRRKFAVAVIALHYVRVWVRIRLLLGAKSPR